MSDIMHLMAVGAPEPVAPFSHAVRAGDFLFVTGQLPIDPHDHRAPIPAGIEAQTRLTMANLQAVLAGAGAKLENTVMARVYLTRFDQDYATMNAVYAAYFAPGKLPARTCIGVTGLARGCLVEIDLIVHLRRAG